MTQTAPQPQPTNGMAIASLVLGIVSIMFVWIPIVGLLGTLMAIIGLVLGILALRHPTGRGLAIGGLVCAGVSMLVTAVYIFGFIAILGAAAASAG